MTLVDTRKIGAKGGKARAANLSAKQRAESAGAASRARWEQYYAEHPEKLKARRERDARKASAKARRKKAKETKGK